MTSEFVDDGFKRHVVIPAAGVGSRMQADRPKQYLKLGDKTVLEHTLECFLNHPAIDSIIVALAENDPYKDELALLEHEKLIVIKGGAERCHSVFNALDYLFAEAEDEDWVLVHDAARPCLCAADINKLINTCSQQDQGGILAVPVRDTMKRGDAECRITETVERDNLWHALTPQMFRLGELHTALWDALDRDKTVTDEASAIEMYGFNPLLVEGQADNIKITRPEDLALAEFYLKQQGRI